MKRNPKTKHLADSIIVLTLVWLSCAVRAEVRSYTLGIDVNCPTGLGE
ncbi:MAG TPA: hypothetical protein VJW76_04145 [Verrucomicrobiae bacterium]|nr:hypothetical protein [Verrucomicrobiae bacterium]